MVKKKEVKVFIEPPDISDISSDSSDEELVQPHVIEETKEPEPEVTPNLRKWMGESALEVKLRRRGLGSSWQGGVRRAAQLETKTTN